MGDQASVFTIAQFGNPVKTAHIWCVFFSSLSSIFGSIEFVGNLDGCRVELVALALPLW